MGLICVLLISCTQVTGETNATFTPAPTRTPGQPPTVTPGSPLTEETYEPESYFSFSPYSTYTVRISEVKSYEFYYDPDSGFEQTMPDGCRRGVLYLNGLRQDIICDDAVMFTIVNPQGWVQGQWIGVLARQFPIDIKRHSCPACE